MQLQQSVGINHPPKKSAQIEEPRSGKLTSRQAQLDSARKELYDLLTQSGLDIARIEHKIARFEDLKPLHWPQPQDYRDVLAVKTKRKSATQVS